MSTRTSTVGCIALAALVLAACQRTEPRPDGTGGGGGAGGDAVAGGGGGGGGTGGGSGGSGGGRGDAGQGTRDAGPIDGGYFRESGDGGRFVWVSNGPPDPATIHEDPVTIERGFTCHPSDVGASKTLALVEGAPGEEVDLQHVGGGCDFHVVYKDSSGFVSPLSAQPSGWVLSVARRFADGVRVVCVSEMRFQPAPGGPGSMETQSVPVRCWAGATTMLTATAEAVPPANDYAAWVRSIEPHPTVPGRYLLTWSRDFSFQFFNMADLGRPATDGLYQTGLVWNGTTLTAQAPVKVSGVTNAFAATPPVPWVPSAAEQATLTDLFDFDGGTP